MLIVFFARIKVVRPVLFFFVQRKFLFGGKAD